jgi:peptidoglycan L-alanyl-D-glutamate endopeptidase CwlK
MVHPALIDVLEEAIKYYDFSVLEGLRSDERQKVLYDTGKSQTLNSKHLRQSDGYSHAVDIAPYPIDWEDTDRFTHLAYLIKGIAASKGISIGWGGDWRSLVDCPHFELRKDK